MINKIIIFCFPEYIEKKMISSFLKICSVPTAEPLINAEYSGLTEILQDVFLSNSLYPDQSHPEAYKNFEQRMLPYIETLFSQQPNELLISHLNYKFIPLWRKFGNEHNLKVEFICLWNHSFEDWTLENRFVRESFAYCSEIISVAGLDMNAFHISDASIYEDECKRRIRSIMGRANIIGDEEAVRESLPLESVVENLKFYDVESALDYHIFEVDCLFSIFKLKRFGSKLNLPSSLEIESIVDSVKKHDSAINTLLSAYDAGKEFDVQNRPVYSENVLVEKNQALFRRNSVVVQNNKELRQNNAELRAKLKELESVSKKRANQVTRQSTPKSSINNSTESEKMARKKAKFKRDPYAYFNDSKKFWVRPLRFLYLHKRK